MSAGKGPVPAIERAFDVLELLSQATRGLSLSDVSRRLRLPKSSTCLILRTLLRRGYLERRPDGRLYHCGLKLRSLGNLALERLELVEEARPFLRSLMNRTGLTTLMALLDRYEAVFVEKIDPPWPNRLNTLWVGRRVPTHCTAIGKALVAHLSKPELERYFSHHSFGRHNQNTIVTLQALRQEFAEIRERNYSVCNEEFQLGFRAVAAPVFGGSGRAVAAISVDGTTKMLPLEDVERNATVIKRTAAALSAHLASLESEDRVL